MPLNISINLLGLIQGLDLHSLHFQAIEGFVFG